MRKLAVSEAACAPKECPVTHKHRIVFGVQDRPANLPAAPPPQACSCKRKADSKQSRCSNEARDAREATIVFVCKGFCHEPNKNMKYHKHCVDEKIPCTDLMTMIMHASSP